AKWSSDPEERKAAIKELSTHGENAISELQEIANITAYEDIKNACAEAIKSMQHARKGVEVNKTSSSSSTIDSSNSAADDVVVTKDQKKEKIENEEKKPKARERDLNQAS
ncbi:MAG: hypothetical protein M3146_02705, partial [Thermoproteota archaeon]|nr:hypothetical protein [Thermoproteota archaeon]